MKKVGTPMIIVGIIAITVIVVAGVLFLSNKFLKKGNEAKQSDVASCVTIGKSYVVNIQNDKATPDHINAKLCDSLSLINNGNRPIIMAFGQHEDHIEYDGVSEKLLNRGDSFTVTLNQSGTFVFHDHIGDVAQGEFTVSK